VAQRDGRGADCRIVGVGFDVLDEGTVEFQALDRQVLQVGE
jgi:hypothetical protein